MKESEGWMQSFRPLLIDFSFTGGRKLCNLVIGQRISRGVGDHNILSCSGNTRILHNPFVIFLSDQLHQMFINLVVQHVLLIYVDSATPEEHIQNNVASETMNERNLLTNQPFTEPLNQWRFLLLQCLLTHVLGWRVMTLTDGRSNRHNYISMHGWDWWCVDLIVHGKGFSLDVR